MIKKLIQWWKHKFTIYSCGEYGCSICYKQYPDNRFLYDANPQCKHEIKLLWSGIRCKKCPGWFCY